MTVKTKKLIGDAKAFALTAHGDQRHGSLHIRDHLEDVANHVAIHYNDNVNIRDKECVIAAAWLHDVLEDTNSRPEDIEYMFGYVIDIVELLTDKKGRNRLERHLRTYHAIRQDNDAMLIKLCDRRHNHERSLRHGEHWLAMYHKEYNYFKFALWVPNKFPALWEELDEQYEEMNRKMSW